MRKDDLKALILVGILGAGIFLQQAGFFEAAGEFERIRPFAETWWAPLVAVILQLILYMFALPGSLVIWSLGAIYPPWAATLLIAAGGVAGSLAAYFFSAELSSSWAQKFTRSKVYKMIKGNAAFLQLFALRCLPGFPHSFINYSSGMLKVSLLNFVLSTALGFMIKGYIYCSAIYQAFHIEDGDKVISFSTAWPLLLLVIFLLASVILKKRYFE